MPTPNDIAFARAAVQSGLLPVERARELLKTLPAGKNLAQAAVEAKLLSREQALKLIESLRRKATPQNPPAVAPAAAQRETKSRPAVPPRPSRTAPAVAVRKPSKLPFLAAAGILFLAAGGVALYFVFRTKPVTPKPKVVASGPIEKKESVAKTPEPETPKEEKKPEDPAKEAFHRRLAEKHKEAEAKLAERKGELKEEREAEAKRLQEFRTRMEKHRFAIKLTSGTSYSNALLTSFSFDAVEVKTDSGTAGVPWLLVTPESTLEIAKAVFAEKPYELGRFLTARRFWKEAKAAFEEAAQKDEDRRSKVEEILPVLDKVVKGEGSFRGSVRRMGRDVLLLSYDFKEAVQAEDFPGRPQPKIAGGSMELAEGRWRLSDLDFTRELDVEMTVKSAGKLTFGFGKYRLELGTESKLQGPKDQEIAKGPGIQADAEVRIRLQVRASKVELYLGPDRALAADLPAESEKESRIGTFSFGVKGGTARVAAPFTVRGVLDAKDLEKRFAELEVLVHRATSDKLDDIRSELEDRRAERFLGKRAGYRVDVSANDSYFVFRMKDVAAYDAIKDKMKSFFQTHHPGDLEEKLGEVLGKHPDVPGLHYFKGLYLAMRTESEKAKVSYQEALKLFPDFFEAMTDLAQLHFVNREYEEGLKLVDQAIRVRPDYAPAYGLRAMLRFAQNPRGLPDSVRDDIDLARVLDTGDDEVIGHRRAIFAVARGPVDLGCVHRHESEHYEVYTDISLEASRLYAERLETALAYYREYAGALYQGQWRRKPRVAIFNTAEAYYTYNELISAGRIENTLGLFWPPYDELVLFEETNPEESLHTLYHEAFHHFMSQLTNRKMPDWFNEGMAEYVGAIEISGGKVVKKGQILKGRLQNLQMILAVGRSFGFEKIMTDSRREFYGEAAPFKYAQAWCMLHFLHHVQDGKYRSMVDRYFQLLLEGKTRQEAFDGVFKGQASDLEKEWKEYARKLK